MNLKLCALLLFLKVVSGYSQINLDSSLVACYALNGNGSEPISNLTGTLQNISPVPNRFAAANSAVNFSCGTSAFITLPASPLLKTQQLCFSAWIKPNASFYPSGYIVYSAFNGTSAPAYALTCETQGASNTIKLQRQTPGGLVILQSTQGISSNVFSHVLFTINNTQMQLFINGVSQGTVSAAGAVQYSAAANVYLGTTNEPLHTAPFCGAMDNVRFYSRTLSIQEVMALYNSDPACVVANAAPVANFTLNPPICVNQSIQLVNLSSNNPNVFSWQTPNAVITNSLDVNPTITYSAAGTHTVRLTVANLLGTSSFNSIITVNPKPIITATANRTMTCKGLGVTISGFGAQTYLWTYPTAQIAITTQTAQLDPGLSTTFTLMGTDSLGCSNTTTLQIRYVSDCIRGVEEVTKEAGVLAFPNPTSQQVELRMEEGVFINIEIVNQLGQKHSVAHSPLNTSACTLDISTVAKGLYTILVTTSVGKKQVKLMVH